MANGLNMNYCNVNLLGGMSCACALHFAEVRTGNQCRIHFSKMSTQAGALCKICTTYKISVSVRVSYGLRLDVLDRRFLPVRVVAHSYEVTVEVEAGSGIHSCLFFLSWRCWQVTGYENPLATGNCNFESNTFSRGWIWNGYWIARTMRKEGSSSSAATEQQQPDTDLE